MIILKVDKASKKAIHKVILTNSRWVLTRKAVIAIWAAADIMFMLYNIFGKNAFTVMLEGDENYGEKNWYAFWGMFAAINIVFPVIYMFVRLAVKRITGGELSERIHESLVVYGNMLEYGYQNQANYTDRDRVVIRIPLDGIRKADVDRRLQRIKIYGRCSQMYYYDYSRGLSEASEEYAEDEVVLYDYFKPSLIKTLEETGIAEKTNETN